MALNKQIHLYSIDTNCFYTESEKEIYNKLVKTRYILSKNEIKYQDGRKTPENHARHKTKLNKIIKCLKESMYLQFERSNEIRTLDPNTFDNRNIVSIFDSTLVRTLGITPNTLTEDLMIVQVYFSAIADDIVKNGFMYKDEKYVLLTASAGQIRTKKFVVIKERQLQKHYQSLTCGLSWDKINELGGVNANKYLAYFGLTNSATDVWEGFDIDRAIVVDDMQTLVNGTVDYIDDATYEIERKVMDIPIEHMDGCGIMLEEKTRMIRAPWIKGLMVTFPFDKFIAKNGCDGVVKDIYGIEHNVVKEGIKYIFTKSQFKMYKYYDSWEQYKENFKKYSCEIGYCNIEEDYIPNAKINYQMLQTLSDMTIFELNALARHTVRDIENIGKDYQTMKKILGATDYNRNKNYMQEVIQLYPEIMRDNYNREILKAVKKKIVKQAKAGKLSVNGKYTFVIPDLYAFCEWLFMGVEKPAGLLKDGEVSCDLYKHGYELDCLRSPHLFAEHCVRTNVRRKEHAEWFVTSGVYISNHDLISRVVQCDWDGDKLLVVQDETLCEVAKRNMQDVAPLYYEMKKAPAQNLDNQTLCDSLNKAYTSGNIGLYSNNISRIWNIDEVTDEHKNIIKLLCMENNFSIDSAKTLYMPTRPKQADKEIKKYTKGKLPHFFIYAKDKEGHQVVPANDSTVNKLDRIIPSDRLTFTNNIDKIDYTVLMMNKKLEWDETCDRVVEIYNEINKSKYNYYSHSNEKITDNFDLWAYQDIRHRILEHGHDINFVVDTLVYYLYNIKNHNNKFTLWACFGDVILSNVKESVKSMPELCPKCGLRKVDGVCSSCLDIENSKIIMCEDCGKEVFIKKTDTRTKKCDMCYSDYRKKYKAEREKQRRQRGQTEI